MKFSGTGVSKNWVVAVLGSNAQTYSCFLSASNLLDGLYKGGIASDALAASIVDATYQEIVDSDRTNASAVLTSGDLLAELYAEAYEAVMPPSRRRRLSQAPAYMPASQLATIFQAVATVSAGYNPCVLAKWLLLRCCCLCRCR